MTSTPFTQARDHLSELLDDVERTHHRVEITRHGRPVAILISPDDLASLEETLDVLSNPDVMRQLAASRDAIDAGEVLDAQQLADLIAKRQRSA